MADLKISQLAALAGANLAAGDLFAAVDVSASETKKITVQDAIGYGVTLIADATIPGAKILFNAGQIAGTAIATSGITATQLAAGAVTAAKLANESTVDLVTTLPASGAYVGQLALDTDDLKLYCWDGSAWQSIKAAGSINTVAGSTAGAINIVVTQSGTDVTISATLDNTSAAAQFLAGPTAAAGAVSYRTIAPGDLPTATTTTKGAVQVNGNGLVMSGDTLQINNTVTASGATYSVVNYDSKGLVTAGRAIQGADLPIATGAATGAVMPGTGLAVTGAGVLNHSNVITGATATKVTYDNQGHITAGTTLADTDIPNLPASKITSGTLAVSTLIGANAITGSKLANASTVKFGGAGSTAGVVTFPTAEFQGQYFFDALNGDLYLYDGSAWQPITITSGELVYGGTYNAITNQVKTVTAAGSAAGLVVGAALPNASTSNLRYYVVVSDSGTGTAPAPTVSLAPPDMLVSSGATWDLIDVSNAIAGQIATNISFTPYGGIAATNVQTALQELEDEKLPKAGGTITGNLEIGTAGSLTFEGSTADGFETQVTVVDPTADRTITLPNASGTVVLSGTIVDADIASGAAIVDTKLATISTASKVNCTALTGTIPTGVLGNSTTYVGTTAVALNRASANQALTGISSIALPGATSGTITVTPAATAGTTAITVPATTGTLVTTGDTGTVTNTMLAGSIADTKLSTISTAGKVSNSATTATSANTASAIVARDASGNFAAGGATLTSVALLGGTSGTLTLTPPAVAGTTAIAFPATAGTVVTTGDTGTVTNTMLAGSIADTKLQTISTAGKVSNSATTATNANTASAIVARDASGNFTAGTITAALTGNASTATTLATARTLTIGSTGKTFNGSADVTWTLTEIGAAGTATNNTFTVAQRSSISALTDGVTITPDFSAANNYSVTLAGNRTLANPTNQVAGQSGSIFITQDATGSRTLAYGANWDFAGGTAPTLSTAANAVDRLDYIVRANGSIHAVLTKAFS